MLGIERDPQAVADARESNVAFLVADVQTLDGVDETFDAVVGRLILMYLPDPVAALRRAAERIRRGGPVIAHQGDLAYDWAAPQSAQWHQAREWMLPTLEHAGVDARMGFRLYRSFIEAGPPELTMTLEATVAVGDAAPAWGWANVVPGAVPPTERLGVATASEVNAETLANRRLSHVRKDEGIVTPREPARQGAPPTRPTAGLESFEAKQQVDGSRPARGTKVHVTGPEVCHNGWRHASRPWPRIGFGLRVRSPRRTRVVVLLRRRVDSQSAR